MNSPSKIVLGIFAGLCAIWDAYTTFGGMYQVAGSEFIALIFTIIINGAIIISFAHVDHWFVWFVKLIIVITALGCDAFTAFNGNIILLSQGSLDSDAKVGIALGMTVISVLSSLLVSFLIFRET